MGGIVNGGACLQNLGSAPPLVGSIPRPADFFFYFNVYLHGSPCFDYFNTPTKPFLWLAV